MFWQEYGQGKRRSLFSYRLSLALAKYFFLLFFSSLTLGTYHFVSLRILMFLWRSWGLADLKRGTGRRSYCDIFGWVDTTRSRACRHARPLLHVEYFYGFFSLRFSNSSDSSECQMPDATGNIF